MNRAAMAVLAALCLPLSAYGQSIVEELGGSPDAVESAGEGAAAPPTRWFKGNTHSHAMILFPIPHGDTRPKKLARWYAERGYNFLCISDHNKVGREAKARSVESDAFILISGSEVTSDSRLRLIYKQRHKDAPKVVIHSTAFNIEPEGWNTKIWRAFTPESTTVDILRSHREATQAAGGISIINHPNFKASISAQDIIDSGIGLFEVYSAYPHAKNHGGGSKPSTEELWDQVLSRGTRLYGVASDDGHHTRKWSRKIKEEMGIHAPPGGAWVMVRAAELTPAAIASAMQAGEFYASSGVHLSRLEVAAGTLAVEVDVAATELEVAHEYVSGPARPASAGQEEGTPRITFITHGGRVVRTVDGAQASISLSEATGYLRAKVSWVAGGKGFHAWTQPVFVD